jgi:hypothetical protein
MHAAPSVDAPLADGRVERALAAALHGVAAFVLVGWLMASADDRLPPAVRDAGPWLAAALACWAGLRWARRILPPDPPVLRWNGQHWQLLPDVDLARLQVQLDVGAWLLLHWRCAADGRTGWGVARPAAAGAHWHGLRVALRAHAGAALAADDEAAAAAQGPR